MKTFGPEFLSSLSPRPHFARYLLTYAAFFIGATLARIKVRGKHHLPKSGPYVIAGNHFSDQDPLFFSYGIQKPINFIAASDQEVEWWFIWAPIIYGWIPVDRKNLSDGGVSYNLLSRPKNGAVYLSAIGKAPIVPIGIYGAERAWEGALKGVRSRVNINIGKPFGPYTLSGTKDDKDKKLHAIGDEMMCRIASLLPNNRQGPFSGHHKIKTYQRENGIVPSPQPFFKEMPEE